MPKLVLHIDGDAFLPSIEQAFNPLLQNKPVIVGGTENQRGVIHSAGYEARRLGVKSGMSLYEASRICPDAVFLKGNYRHYKAVTASMQAIYYQYTPEVKITSPDDAYLILRNISITEAREIAETIQKRIRKELGITVSIGISGKKFISKIASEMHKPNGITVIDAEEEEKFPLSLPVGRLPGIGVKTEETLHELSVFTVKELREIPSAVLEKLFGLNGRKFYLYARGREKATTPNHTLPSSVSRETTFARDINDRETILSVLHYLTQRAGSYLLRHKLEGKQIKIKIRYADFSEDALTCSLTAPLSSPADIFSVVQKLYDNAAVRRTNVRLAGVQISRLRRKQPYLLMDNRERQSEKLNTAVSAIRERFGFSAILPAQNLLLKKQYGIDKNGFILHSPAMTR